MTTRPVLTFSIIFLFLGVNFVFMPGLATADGNRLLKKCNAGLKVLDHVKNLSNLDYMDSAFCAGLVQGITDCNRIYRLSNAVPFFCLPEKTIDKDKATRSVVKYLRENPEKLHLHESNLIIDALNDAFPCPGK